jgi:hypothetical protein
VVRTLRNAFLREWAVGQRECTERSAAGRPIGLIWGDGLHISLQTGDPGGRMHSSLDSTRRGNRNGGDPSL